jgi:hypothetical protein
MLLGPAVLHLLPLEKWDLGECACFASCASMVLAFVPAIIG